MWSTLPSRQVALATRGQHAVSYLLSSFMIFITDVEMHLLSNLVDCFIEVTHIMHEGATQLAPLRSRALLFASQSVAFLW